MQHILTVYNLVSLDVYTFAGDFDHLVKVVSQVFPPKVTV